MAKSDQFPTMDPFSPAHQPDEGYSEEPINPAAHHELSAALATLRSPADLPTWLASNASVLPVSIKTELTLALLDELPTSVIAEIVQRLNPRLYIDFIQYLPAEICLKILGYLDPVSLVSVIQTCRTWYDLALDRKLWERLYHMEGWKAIHREIELCETRVNAGLNNSIGQLHRIQTEDGSGSSGKARATSNDDEDLEMTDGDRVSSLNEAFPGTGSIFGSPDSSFTSNRTNSTPMGEMDLDSLAFKGKGVDPYVPQRPTGTMRQKRKEPGGSPESSLPPIAPAQSPGDMVRSTLWTWDVNSSRYRINWKYLYNMRRRLESNWELGKFTTFQLPHPSFPEEGHQECVYTLQFDANYLVSGSRDQTMRVWNMHTRRLVRPPLMGHTGSVLCLQFDADPGEDLLVSGSSDSNIFIWKFSTGELVQKITRAHRESVLNVRFDKRVLVTSSKDKTIKIFNRRPLRYGDLGYAINDQVVNPVATNLRRYGYEPDLAQELPVKAPYTLIGRLDGHSAAVNAIQVRDRTIVSVSGDRQIKIWDWPDQVCTLTIPAHDKGIACVEFDERRVVSGSSDYEVCIFDALTGLKVAQLRGHAHLVRTVQAGFGDFPYSKAEDEAEAIALDAEYRRAVEVGEIEHEPEQRRPRRNRRVNAGSSRIADVQAVGAKVPPGGGGGRKYGRIVSGSYDQSIIIWRRDKEGVWKPAHHLRQEEAAAAAQRQTNATMGMPVPAPMASIPMHPPTRPAVQQPAPTAQQQPAVAQSGNVSLAPMQDPHGGSQRSASLYMALIDQVVPLGVGALQHSLTNYPVMLVYHNYLQATIEREPSPFVRAQLRHAVTSALMSIQNGQSARQRMSAAATPVPAASLPYSPGQTSSAGAIAGSSSSQSVAAGSSSANIQQSPLPLPSIIGAPQMQPAQPATSAQATPTPASVQSHHPHQQLPPPPMVGVGHGQQPGPPRHPHITGATEIAPARAFKLQFDAHKIVCCSQVPVIVGWDFCNGDPELEETARFFATVD